MPEPAADRDADGAPVDMELVGFVAASKYRADALARLVEGPATPSAIAADVGHQIAHISRALSRLRDRGLAELLVAEDRTKGRIYGVTDAGRAVAERASDVGVVRESHGDDAERAAQRAAEALADAATDGDPAADAPDAPRPDDFPKRDRRRVFAVEHAADRAASDPIIADSEEVTGRLAEIERLLYDTEDAAVEEAAAANARRARALVVDVLVGDGAGGDDA